MFNRVLISFFSLVALLGTLLPVQAQFKKPKIGFLPGVVDPFYQVMEIGVKEAAENFGLSGVTQYPQTWGPSVQTPILDAMVARGDLEYLIIAPTDKEQMVAPLQRAVDAGIKVITVDTFLGDGDYANDKVTFPISYIGSDNEEGGKIAARALAKVVGNKGKVYIQNTNVGASTTEQRGKGFKEGIDEFKDMQVVGEDYNLDDAGTAAQQTSAKLQATPDLVGILGVNVFSAQGAGNAVKAAGWAEKCRLSPSTPQRTPSKICATAWLASSLRKNLTIWAIWRWNSLWRMRYPATYLHEELGLAA